MGCGSLSLSFKFFFFPVSKKKIICQNLTYHPDRKLNLKRRIISCAVIQFGWKFFLAQKLARDSLLINLRISLWLDLQPNFCSLVYFLNISFYFLDKISNQTFTPIMYYDTVIYILFRFTLNWIFLGRYLLS